MKILITGGTGQLGRALQATAPMSHDVHAPSTRELDITRVDGVLETIDRLRPDVIINCAAYTDVDKAEKEHDRAFAVNANGPTNLASAAQTTNARLIHVSTDYVFGDTQCTPYAPTAQPAPLGVYGASKRAGEEKVLEIGGANALLIRTAWLYDANGRNFVNTMLRVMRDKPDARVVADQIGTPTWTYTLTQVIWAAIFRPTRHGIYHWTDAGVASWYDFACAIQEEALALKIIPRAIPIHPITSEEYPTPARRPHYSVLDKSNTVKDFDVTPMHWRLALRHMLTQVTRG